MMILMLFPLLLCNSESHVIAFLFYIGTFLFLPIA